MTLAEVSRALFPVFIKPVTPKQFRGAVYQSAATLAEECRGLTPDIKVFVAEQVRFTAEVRSFVLDRQILDASVYEGTADVVDAAKFAREVIEAMKLPRTVVIDVGFIAERGWAVIEFNAAWGSGLNGCDAEKVFRAIIAASAST